MPDPTVSNFIPLVILVLVAAALSLADRRLLRTWCTPFILLAGPYTAVVLLAAAIGPSLGFTPLYAPSLWIWAGGLAAFWAGGWLLAWPLLRTVGRDVPRPLLELRYEDTTRRPLFVLSWLCVLALGISAVSLLLSMGGLAALGTDAFTTAYSSGIAGHLLVVTQLLLVFWIGSLRRLHVGELLTLGALLAVTVLYQGKGALMIPVIGGIIYRLLAGRLRLNWRSVLLVAVAGYLMFNVIYLLTFSSGDVMALFSSQTYSELFYHFWTFLFAGVLGWSNVVRDHLAVSAPPSFLIEPVFNLGAVVLRHDLLAGHVSGFDYLLIHPERHKLTNVITMFGVMQSALGVWGALAAAALLGGGYYALLIVTLRTRNAWLAATYAFCAAVLCFGWFSYFFSLLTYWEAPAFGLLFALLAALRDKKRSDKPLPDPILRDQRKHLPAVLPALSLLLAVALAVTLALVVAWPLVLRNAANLPVLADPAADISRAPAASPYLRGIAALHQGDAGLALDLLRRIDQDSQDSQLVRGQYALAWTRATGDWQAAAALLLAERPLPHYLLDELLRPHIGEFNAAALDSWRAQLRSTDPMLLINLALELLIQGNNDAAEQWARALPGYETSMEARRIVAQAHLNRGQYAEAVVLFQELYAEDAGAVNAYWVGRALLLAERYEESIVALEQAVATTDHDLGWYQADLGLAYGLAGRCAQANATAGLALSGDPSADLRARVAQVRDTINSVCP